ncbi:hypothetical protein ACFV3N_00290 [Streptomyces bauhiniae]|uniref:hypothetical protein n=1 Tax=Streptomyces bauhiniae TaxID=2340725 RepID=UPI003668DCEE
MPEAPYGPYQGFTVPPMPSGPPPAPPSALRAAAVALLNLSGLGLGYALLRRWGPLALCLAATAVLLFVALPADADGLPTGVLVGYLVVLLLAAAHGARLGLRTPLSPRAPLALLLGLVLLAVPAGGALWYDGARAEAEQQALLGRLEKADDLVAAAGRHTFAASRADYRSALAVYRDLAVDHPGSRAADRVPARMRAYYSSVGAAYGRGEYCVAVEPLQFLRTVPRTMPAGELGSLARWPDDRLATSLYECGKADLGDGGEAWTGRFRELLADFPGSPAAAKVVPAVDAAVRSAQQGSAGRRPAPPWTGCTPWTPGSPTSPPRPATPPPTSRRPPPAPGGAGTRAPTSAGWTSTRTATSPGRGRACRAMSPTPGVAASGTGPRRSP